ncbi:hypothetical protein TNCV_3573251 [Trichonephila clavipes]|nr:hypothetical protein TNCV_3573251 [Trichonephila clavipes]
MRPAGRRLRLGIAALKKILKRRNAGRAQANSEVKEEQSKKQTTTREQSRVRVKRRYLRPSSSSGVGNNLAVAYQTHLPIEFSVPHITKWRYISNILNPFVAALPEEEETNSYFQLDGANAHSSHRTMDPIYQSPLLTELLAEVSLVSTLAGQPGHLICQ